MSESLKLSARRSNLLRIAYAILAFGLTIVQLPLLLSIGPGFEIMHGFVVCMLAALCLLSYIGLFKPVTLLPILFFEIIWKLLWLCLVGIPAWLAGPLNDNIASNVFACMLVVPIIVLIPWDYIWQKLTLR